MPRKSRMRFRLLVSEEYRPMQFVPARTFAIIWLVVLVTLGLQVRINLNQPPPQSSAIHLPNPLSQVKLSALALGDKVFTAKVVMLWLQAFDNQQGQSVSYHDLDYDLVAGWLTEIADLDPRSDYPLMTATSVYTGVTDTAKIRKMVDYVAQEFATNPRKNWKWMASAATLAKNKLDDTEYALKLARELRMATAGDNEVPSWAKQMEVFLLQDLNSYEASANLVLSLVRSGEITDPQEFSLHLDRLTKLRETLLREGKVRDQNELLRMQQILDLIQDEYFKNQGLISS